jgi:hypothetical protein
MRQDRIIASICLPTVVVAVVVTLFVTAPKAEDFWWTDAPSFALNGELVRDYIASGLRQSPTDFANLWFRHYPALSISLYPPIFPLAEALTFALFGFSHAAAQATVAVFSAVAAVAICRVARLVANPLAAAAAILLTFSAPGILLWSRQVMMELPTLAFLLLAAGNFLHYQTERRSRDLMLAAFFVICAVYTKQPAIFVAPAFAIALLFENPARILRDRIVWLTAALSVLALLPLAAFTVWGQRDSLDVALGQGIAAHSGAAGLLAGQLTQIEAYFLALPEIVGWPLLIGAFTAVMLMSMRGWGSVPEMRLAILMITWFACDFVGVALTGHFEARYGMALGVPCAILSLVLLQRLPMGSASAFAFAAGAALFAISVATEKVSTMAGYDKVAAYIIAHTKPDDVVWFEAKESKNLIFSLRSHDPLHPLFILRCEKFLIDYHVAREWGVRDRGWTQTDIKNLIDRNKVIMFVLQPDFWTDLPSMALMQAYILSDRFKQVAEFPITADDPSQRTTIRLFVDRGPADGSPTQADK